MLVGTADGLHEVAEGGGARRVGLAGQEVTALAVGGGGVWAVVGGKAIARSDAPDGGQMVEVAATDRWEATCLVETPSGLLVGTDEAHLLRLAGDRLEPVAGFEAAPGRPEWYTPWGGPAAVRSVSVAADGALLVNVHVGGILRSTDDGATWAPTVDIHADVHQVLAVGDEGRTALAAAAVGLLESDDGGAGWKVVTDGLHSTYCRAVAVAGGHLLLSASTGPQGDRSALYRRRLDGDGPLERGRGGLPVWLPGNIDTGCIAAPGGIAALGTGTGLVLVSDDEGETWREAAGGLPPVRAVVVL